MNFQIGPKNWRMAILLVVGVAVGWFYAEIFL